MTRSRTALLASLLLVPALGFAAAHAEDPAPAEDGKPAAEKPAEKVERKTTPEAEKALSKFATLLALPTSDATAMACNASTTLPMFGENEVRILPSWTKADGFQIAVRLPEEFTAQMAPEQVTMLESMIAGQFQQGFRFAFVSLASQSKAYHVAHKDSKRGLRVELLPLEGDGVDWERLLCYFDDRGLVTTITGIPRVDINDPNAAMLAGTEVEAEFHYTKHGERFAIESLSILTVSGAFRLTMAYYDVKEGHALPRSVKVESDMLPAPVDVVLHDYQLDGRHIEGTEKQAEEEAPETGTDGKGGKDAEKPAGGDEK